MSPTNPEPKTRRRATTWTGLAVCMVLGATLVGCSDDGGNEQTGPTTTVDIKAAEHEVQCELVKSYVSLETSTRGSIASSGDEVTVQDFEKRRVVALDRVLGTFKGAVPAEVTAAADQLRALAITVPATEQSTQQATTSLKQLTDYFDPQCDTEGGRDRDDDATTLPPASNTTAAGTPTSAPVGGPASTDTTATTAASTSTSG
jgi:hypothetical protein